jgi:sugar O-acyltransferase (sialic acid O-acetyltransferase NeuD family)
MIVVGAKGLAKELLEILSRDNLPSSLYFFDNLSDDIAEKLFDRYLIIRTFEDVRKIFIESGDFSFSLGLGNPVFRRRLCDEFLKLGGRLTSVISSRADIGKFGIQVGDGCCILPGVVITSSVTLGQGCLINPNATISHDCVLGNFVEVSPGANITGNCRIGDYSFIGSNCVVLPKITIGSNVIVGAGAVVTRDVGDNCVVAGVPAVVKRKLDPIKF